MDTTALFSGAGLLVLMGLLSALEHAAPLQPRSAANARHWRVNLPLMALALTGYALLYGPVLAGAAYTREAGIGLLPLLGWTGTAGTLATIVGLDLATYWAHRSMHLVPPFWRFHRVHHLDDAVDATTAFRQHPCETVYRAVALGVGATALGAAPGAILLYRTLSAINAILEHANIRVPLRLDAALARGFVTPNMHKIHHSRARPETDSNYGNLLSGFDRLFGSFVPTERAPSVRYGLDAPKAEDARSLSGALLLPFAPIRSPAREVGTTTDTLP